MKCVSIFSAASKSAMTPSFIGLIAVMLPGVRPEHLLGFGADRLDAAVDLVDRDDRRLARRRCPVPRAKMQVLAVPRSMARSWEKRDRNEANMVIRG